MKIAALCKTFQGHEFIPAMVDSINDVCDNIVFVNSEISWHGRKGNTCKPVINELMQHNDKIIAIDKDTTSQDEQCACGYNYIKTHLQADYVLIIDTDEVWDKDVIRDCVEFIEQNPGEEAYKSGLYDYIKSIRYQITPPPPHLPVAFIRGDLPTEKTLGARHCKLRAKQIVINGEIPKYHHYIYIRDSFNTVLEKIMSSHIVEDAYYTDMSKWIPEVWNQIPELKGEWSIKGFHVHANHRTNWMGLRIIDESAMPESVLKYNKNML